MAAAFEVAGEVMDERGIELAIEVLGELLNDFLANQLDQTWLPERRRLPGALNLIRRCGLRRTPYPFSSGSLSDESSGEVDAYSAATKSL